MSWLRLFMATYFGGVVLFAGWLVVVLTNLSGLTSIQLPLWPLFVEFILMMGSKYLLAWQLKRGAKHG